MVWVLVYAPFGEDVDPTVASGGVGGGRRKCVRSISGVGACIGEGAGRKRVDEVRRLRVHRG